MAHRMSQTVRFLTLLLALALAPSVALAQSAPPSDVEGRAEGDGRDEDDASAAPTVGASGGGAPSEGGALGSPTATPTIDADLEAEAQASEEDEAAEGSAEEAAQETAAGSPASVPLFRGSLFSWQQGVTIATMAPGLLQTHNPTYYWSFFFQPRLNVDTQNFFVLTLAGAIEWTNSDYTAHEREPVFYDTTVEYRHMERWEGFVFLPSVRLTAPTSLTSVAADRYLLAGAGLTVVRAFPELADLTIALAGRYSHWFAGSNVNTTLGGQPSTPCLAVSASGPCTDQVGGAGTIRDQLLSALTVTAMPSPGLTFTLQYAFSWAYRHDLDVTASTGPDDTQHWRNMQYFTLAVAYDVQPWLNLQLGYQTSNGFARTLDENGNAFSEHVNPFWDSSSSELYLVATVPLDALYEAIAPSAGEEELTPEQLQRRRQGLAGRAPGITF